MLTRAYLSLREVGSAAVGYELCCRAIADRRENRNHRDNLALFGDELRTLVSDPWFYTGNNVFCESPGLNYLLNQLPQEYTPSEGDRLTRLADVLHGARSSGFDEHSSKLADMFHGILLNVNDELRRVTIEGGLPRAPNITSSGLIVIVR